MLAVVPPPRHVDVGGVLVVARFEGVLTNAGRDTERQGVPGNDRATGDVIVSALTSIR